MAQDAPKGTKLEFEVSGKLKGTGVVAAQKGTMVTVENLFNNLPVRRRELERNIKREWNRVVGHLSQYACIQTGIKFSVTQQAGKGKKTTLFSTKGNQTTRENIVSVFGAKTLTALIALDLKLELEPTSGPSQRWSAQDDGGKKDIRIVGHISRPASGEGRQTPDRQMFFVNSRPCGLPQVAKAFNEVYKTYNGSQSPFIFANIELDTHLYDVNVSPDKRTILLHDQNRMLENLKEALIALFESQDYTVPISQLSVQKQPSYKQLTISRDSATPSKTPTPQPQTPKVHHTPAEFSEDEEAEHGSRASRRDEHADSESSRKPFNPQYGRGAVSQEARTRSVSRDSLNREQQSVSLISNWLGRKTAARSEEPAEPSKGANEKPEGLSKEKLRLVEKLKQDQKEDSLDTSEDPQSPVSEGQSPPLFVSDTEPTDAGHRRSMFHAPADDSPESPIPSLQSPPKPTPSIADRFSNNLRSSFRAPTEIATITIGNYTVTSSIGTPCPKRTKTDHVSSIGRNARPSQALALAKKSPSFGSILSQRFAAPGSGPQAAPADDDIEDDDDPRGRSVSPQIIESSPENSGEADDYQDIDDTIELQSVKEEEVEVDISAVAPSVDENDSEYVDEAEKRAREEAKVQEMIKKAENAGSLPSQENVRRAKILLRGGNRKKDSTVSLVRTLETSAAAIEAQFRTLNTRLESYATGPAVKSEDDGVESSNAEEKLSLTISKSDFAKMKIVGQFNLGFILASRTSEKNADTDGGSVGDDLFIIDQHASDEKYNFERLQATTIVQSQRLVHPKTLDLTAMEEEIVMENLSALSTNGFIVNVDTSGDAPVGQRCQLVALPLSRETAFSLTDLDELLALLAEPGVLAGGVPRPSKVRKMFAMRACRSSVMIGKTLTERQMGTLVRHLGELDKPWNCPHGRPTMRHLCGLSSWDEMAWKEGDLRNEDMEEADVIELRGRTDWAAYVRANAGGMEGGVKDEAGEDMEATMEDQMNAEMYEAYSSAMQGQGPEPEVEEDEDSDSDGEESTDEL